jgi:hypothetical protein
MFGFLIGMSIACVATRCSTDVNGPPIAALLSVDLLFKILLDLCSYPVSYLKNSTYRHAILSFSWAKPGAPCEFLDNEVLNPSCLDVVVL